MPIVNILIDLGNTAVRIRIKDQTTSFPFWIQLLENRVNVFTIPQAEAATRLMHMFAVQESGLPIKFYPLNVTSSPDKVYSLTTGKHILSPEQLVAAVLKAMLQSLPHFRVLVSEGYQFAAIFNKNEFLTNLQLEALQTISRLLGFHKACLVDESAALALHYVSEHIKATENSHVIGLVSISSRGWVAKCYRVHRHAQIILQVQDSELGPEGGDHVTRVLAEDIMVAIRNKNAMRIDHLKPLMHELYSKVEQSKIALSSSNEAYISLSRMPDQSTFSTKLISSDLEKATKLIYGPVVTSLHAWCKRNPTMERIIISGNSTRLPWLGQKLQSLGSNTIFAERELVVKGLGLWLNATVLALADRSYSVNTQQGKRDVLIRKGDRVPTYRSIKARYPRGETSFWIQLYQDTWLLRKYKIVVCPKEDPFTVTLHVDPNGLASLSARTSTGLIQMSNQNRHFKESPIQAVIN